MQPFSILVGAGMGRKKSEVATAQRNTSPDVERPNPDAQLPLNSPVSDQAIGSRQSPLEPADIASLLQFFKLLHKLESEKRQR